MPLSSSKFFSRYLPLTLSVLLLVFGVAVVMVLRDKNKTADAAWYSSSWTYRKPITIDKNKVSGVATSTHSSFPMLFSVTDTDLKYTSYSGKVGKTDGTDILFTSSDGITKLSHEIEKYSSSTGETIIWVKIPTLSTTSDTTIYIYFGNSGASDQQDATNVWDSNYTFVNHLSEASGTPLDSTSNNNDMSTIGGSPDYGQTGKIGYGMNFDGSTEYIRTSGGTLTNAPTASGAYTMSLWWNTDVEDDDNVLMFYGAAADNQSNGLRTKISPGGDGYYNYWYNNDLAAEVNLTTGTWYRLDATYDGTTRSIYHNGTLLKSDTPAARNSPNSGFYIASNIFSNYWDGKLDDPRMSIVARNADWIKTEYNNQTSPSTFYAYGSVQIERVINFPSLSAPANIPWYSSSWTYRKPITIDKNKVSGIATSTHSSFPMLFSVTDTDLKYTSHGGKVASTTGADILFTSSDGTTKLSHEIEKYSSSTGETIIWVKIPLLSATSDTTIYIYFGNSGASDQQDAANVWDSNYKGVWHLGEATGTYFDSTSNNNDSTNETLSARAQAGKIGLAPRFSSSTPDKIVLPGIQLTNGVTLSSWFYPTETTQYARIIARAYTANSAPYINYSLVFDTNNPPKIIFGLGIGGATYDLVTNRTFLFNRWHNITATYDGSNTKVYVDGVLDNSAARTGNIDTITQVVEIGHNTVFSPANDRQSFTGYIDESRISNTARNADWIKTEYNNQTSPATFYAYGALGTERSSTNRVKDRGASGVSWYSNSWTYRKPITIDKNKVSGVATSTHSSFPMLFSVTDTDLKYTSHGGKVASTTGADILFTSSDGSTKLSHEIEKYSSSTGETIIWVKIPTLSATSDTTIYIYFGNSGASDQQDATNVWDSNFKTVWHYRDGTTLSLLDSTSNANNGTNHGPTAVSGKIGGALNAASASSQYISSPQNGYFSGSSQHSYSAWIKPVGATSQQVIFYNGLDSTNSATYLEIGNNGCGNNIVSMGIYGTTPTNCSQVLSTNEWHYIYGTYNGSVFTTYVDGVASPTQSVSPNIVNNYTNTARYSGGLYFNGSIDELRVSNTARNADWIKTEYNNQSSPATFYSYGAVGTSARQDSSGGSTPTVKVRGGVKFR